MFLTADTAITGTAAADTTGIAAAIGTAVSADAIVGGCLAGRSLAAGNLRKATQ